MSLPPGPRWPAAIQTLLWIGWPVELMRRCAGRYPGLFTLRIATLGEVVFVTEPAFVKAIFALDAEQASAGYVNAVLRPLVGEGSLLLLDGAEHLRHRRLLTPPFHGERLRVYAQLIRSVAERAAQTWDSGGVVAMQPYMQRVTLELILRAVFGLEGDEELAEMRLALSRLMAIGDSRLSGILLLPALQRRFPGSPWQRFLERRAQVDRLLYAKIRRRRVELARGPARDHVLDLMLTATDDAGRGLSDQELRDELMTLLIAGHETTATSLCWTLERLLDHPAALARLQAELSTAGPEPESLIRLPYLDAVIREALRLRPVVPIVGRRLLRPLTLGDRTLEAGTVVAPNVFMTGRLPHVFENPDAFEPERFLSGRPAPWEWFPFGGGNRRCLGMAFALYEMKVVLGTLLSQYELGKLGRGPARTVRRGVILAPRGRSLFSVQRREPRRAGDRVQAGAADHST